MQERIGQLCHQFKLPTMGAQAVARFTASGHGDALPTFWRCWSRRPRTAATGASTGCARSPGSLRARPGRPSSTTGCPWRSDSSWTNWPRAASWTAASTCWPSVSPAPESPTPVRHRTQVGGVGQVGALRAGLPAGAGVAGRQAGPGAAPAAAPAGQLRFPAPDDLGYLPQGAEESRSSSPSSQNGMSAGPWASRQTWSSRSGSGSSPTPWPPRLPSTGWSITPSSWSSMSPATAPMLPSNGSGTGGEPAKLVDANRQECLTRDTSLG